MQEDKKKACHLIIHAAAVSAGGVAAGLAQFPGSDSVPLVNIQVFMIIALAREFGVEMERASAMAALSTFAATMVGRGASQALIGWVPGLGNAANAATAAAVTEAIGWGSARTFADQKKLT